MASTNWNSEDNIEQVEAANKPTATAMFLINERPMAGSIASLQKMGETDPLRDVRNTNEILAVGVHIDDNAIETDGVTEALTAIEDVTAAETDISRETAAETDIGRETAVEIDTDRETGARDDDILPSVKGGMIDTVAGDDRYLTIIHDFIQNLNLYSALLETRTVIYQLMSRQVHMLIRGTQSLCDLCAR